MEHVGFELEQSILNKGLELKRNGGSNGQVREFLKFKVYKNLVPLYLKEIDNKFLDEINPGAKKDKYFDWRIPGYLLIGAGLFVLYFTYTRGFLNSIPAGLFAVGLRMIVKGYEKI